MYLWASASTTSQPSAPSSHVTTLPRSRIGENGLSGAVSEIATRGSLVRPTSLSGVAAQGSRLLRPGPGHDRGVLAVRADPHRDRVRSSVGTNGGHVRDQG